MKKLLNGTCVVCFGGPDTFLGRVCSVEPTGRVLVCGVLEGCWQPSANVSAINSSVVQEITEKEFLARWIKHFEVLRDASLRGLNAEMRRNA